VKERGRGYAACSFLKSSIYWTEASKNREHTDAGADPVTYRTSGKFAKTFTILRSILLFLSVKNCCIPLNYNTCCRDGVLLVGQAKQPGCGC
jgi:hypothetical protein